MFAINIMIIMNLIPRIRAINAEKVTSLHLAPIKLPGTNLEKERYCCFHYHLSLSNLHQQGASGGNVSI